MLSPVFDGSGEIGVRLGLPPCLPWGLPTRLHAHVRILSKVTHHEATTRLAGDGTGAAALLFRHLPTYGIRRTEHGVRSTYARG